MIIVYAHNTATGKVTAMRLQIPADAPKGVITYEHDTATGKVKAVVTK